MVSASLKRENTRLPPYKFAKSEMDMVSPPQVTFIETLSENQ